MGVPVWRCLQFSMISKATIQGSLHIIHTGVRSDGKILIIECDREYSYLLNLVSKESNISHYFFHNYMKGISAGKNNKDTDSHVEFCGIFCKVESFDWYPKKYWHIIVIQ